MSKMFKRIVPALALILVLLCLVGCEKDEKRKPTTGGNEGTAPVAEGIEDWSETPTQQTTGQATTQPTTGQAATQPTTGQAATQPTTGQAATQPTTGQATTQPTTGQVTTQPTTGQQTGNQEQPTRPGILTLKEYNAMTNAQKQAYFKSFSSPDAFYEWLEEAEKADKDQNNTVTGDGTLDLNDHINNNN